MNYQSALINNFASECRHQCHTAAIKVYSSPYLFLLTFQYRPFKWPFPLSNSIKLFEHQLITYHVFMQNVQARDSFFNPNDVLEKENHLSSPAMVSHGAGLCVPGTQQVRWHCLGALRCARWPGSGHSTTEVGMAARQWHPGGDRCKADSCWLHVGPGGRCPEVTAAWGQPVEASWRWVTVSTPLGGTGSQQPTYAKPEFFLSSYFLFLPSSPCSWFFTTHFAAKEQKNARTFPGITRQARCWNWACLTQVKRGNLRTSAFSQGAEYTKSLFVTNSGHPMAQTRQKDQRWHWILCSC